MECRVFKGFCHNCKHDLIEHRDEQGISKSCCPHCGAVNVSQFKTRRVLYIKVIAPDDNEEVL